MALPWEREREREKEGDGCQVAKMQKKSGCGRGLPLRRGRSDVCRLEDFLRGEGERERAATLSIHGIVRPRRF